MSQARSEPVTVRTNAFPGVRDKPWPKSFSFLFFLLIFFEGGGGGGGKGAIWFLMCLDQWSKLWVNPK